MRTITLLKTSALAISAAAVFCLPFLTTGKKYTPRPENKGGLYTNFDGAAQYYHWLKMNASTGMLDLNAMLEFEYRKTVTGLKKMNGNPVLGLTWREMGPDNVGGRCRAILVDKFNSSHLYAGGVSGGLFESHNYGTNWTAIGDSLSTLIVSCITQDGDGNIYIGTGEGMARGGSGDGNSAFPGGGMYKMTYNSSNGTYSYPTKLATTVPTHNSGGFFTWTYVNNVKCSPFRSSSSGQYIVYAGTYKGLQISMDGGASWAAASSLVANLFCEDIDVANDGTVYAALGGVGNSGNKIFYLPADSLGHGVFKNITPTGGIFISGNMGRIEVCAAPTKSNIVYASIAKPLSSSTGAISLGIIQSYDYGTTWSTIGTGSATFLPFASYGQGDYDHVLQVFPNNPYAVILGGTDLYRWDQVDTTIAHRGIGQWTQIANQFESPSNPTYVHADKHTITFDPNNSNKLYIGCDGGVFRSTDGANTFSAVNNGFNATQFYAVSFERDALWTHGSKTGQYDSAGVFGGAQDNGTQYISGNENTVKSAVSINGGDGFYSAASMLSPEVFFTTSYYGELDRTSSRTYGANFYPTRQMISCTNTAKPGDGSFASFITPIALWESSNMTNSPYNVEFVVDSLKIPSVALANGSQTSFTFYIPKPQTSAIIVVNGLKISAGTDEFIFTGTGTVTNTYGTATYTAAGDIVNITFNTPPPANTPIKVVCAVTYNAGDQIFVMSNSLSEKFGYTLPSALNVGDTIYVQDILQAKLAFGLNGAAYICANPLNFAATPNWVKVAGPNSVTAAGASAGFNGMVQTMAWGGADVLYIGNTSGSVYRVSGIAAVTDSASSDIDSTNCARRKTSPIVCASIANFNRSITSISVDPTNPDRIIVTLGNYGSQNHVYYCGTATTCPVNFATGNFTLKGTVDNAVYSSTFVQTSYGQTNSNTVLIGTEDGVYSMDITNPSAGWVSEKSNSFPNVPTFMLKQQTLPNWQCYNSGVIYAGTHGRGFWSSHTYHSPLSIGINEIKPGDKGSAKAVKIFPNPSKDFTTVNFALSDERKISISVYDLKGDKIKTISCGKLSKGSQNFTLSLDGMASGTYIVAVADEKEVLGTSRLVKID